MGRYCFYRISKLSYFIWGSLSCKMKLWRILIKEYGKKKSHNYQVKFKVESAEGKYWRVFITPYPIVRGLLLPSFLCLFGFVDLHITKCVRSNSSKSGVVKSMKTKYNIFYKSGEIFLYKCFNLKCSFIKCLKLFSLYLFVFNYSHYLCKGTRLVKFWNQKNLK